MKRITGALGGLLAAVLAGPALAAEEKGAEYGYGMTADPAEGWDHLWVELLIDITVIGVVFGAAALYMMFRFKAKDPEAVGTAKPLTKGQAWAWALIPAFIFMADDFFLSAKGWDLWNTYRRVPDGALEIQATAMMYSWEFDYGEDVVTDELVVPVGQPVVLRMTSTDVLHSFFLPEYRVKEDVMPGRVTYLWFYPKKPYETLVTCTEFCGAGHSVMSTPVTAVPRETYEKWYAETRAEARAEAESERADAATTQSDAES